MTEDTEWRPSEMSWKPRLEYDTDMWPIPEVQASTNPWAHCFDDMQEREVNNAYSCR